MIFHTKTAFWFILMDLLLFSHGESHAQLLREKQLSLDNQVAYINQCADEYAAISDAVYQLYQEVKLCRQNKRHYTPHFECPMNQETYYRDQARLYSPSVGQRLTGISERMEQALAAIREKGQSLEIYFRLKKYEKDNYEGALEDIRTLQDLSDVFLKEKNAYEKALKEVYEDIKPSTGGEDFKAAESRLRELIALESALLQQLAWNFNPETPVGWPLDQIQMSVNAQDLLLDKLRKQQPKLGYPASHFYASTLDCLAELQQCKKLSIDQYSAQARETDEYAGQQLNNLLRLYNGCLVSFLNQFGDQATGHKTLFLKTTHHVAGIRFNQQAYVAPESDKQFTDLAYESPVIAPQHKVLSLPVAQTIDKLVEFTDECIRVNNNLTVALRNNGFDAASLDGARRYYFNYEQHPVPHSLFQECLLSLRELPESAQPSLRAQLETLYSMMCEMESLRGRLDKQCKLKEPNATAIKNIRARYLFLFERFDAYSQRFHADLTTVYQNWQHPQNSWTRSHAELNAVRQEGQAMLEAAGHFYKSKRQSWDFDPAALNQAIENCIRNQFRNLEGIQKLGRYNGLCPYSPYEDIAEYAQTLSTYAAQAPQKKYDDFLYLYNNMVAEYNRFAALSKTPLLKQIRKPELFLLRDTPPKNPGTGRPPQADPPVPKPAPAPEEKSGFSSPKATILHDTIYIRDTIYLEKPPLVQQDFYSLEHFAPNNLVFLLDVSSSMNNPERLPLLKASIARLVSLLRPEDEISIVTYSGQAQVLLLPCSGRQKEKIYAVLEALTPGGKTEVQAGLDAAYKVLNQNFKTNGNNKVVLATDGEFSLSQNSMDKIALQAQAEVKLSIFKFGSKPSPGLKKIADQGQGNLVRITPDNAEIYMIMEAQQGRKQ